MYVFILTIVQTRYALSDEATFGPGGPGNKRQRSGFPHCDFYRELLEHKALMSNEELSGLIQWWNGYIDFYTLLVIFTLL